jgi:hypothetical protein
VARRPVRNKPEEIRKQLINVLSDFHVELEKDSLREKVLALVPAVHLLRDLGSSLIDESIRAARDRIIFYFKKYPRKIIHGDELMVVSGISEWARRIRELRVEFGWSIISGITAKEVADADAEEGIFTELDGRPLAAIAPDQYILMDENVDRDAAYRWNIANAIRKSEGGVQDKVLRFLRANVGKPVTGEELRYVANDKTEWARRTRELRTDEGWPVITKSQGRNDLPVGIYLLEEDRQVPQHDRRIPDAVRVAVLERDKFSCRKCGWRHENLSPFDPRKLLELHHRIHYAKGGEHTVENLITLCNVHHDEIHASGTDIEKFLLE